VAFILFLEESSEKEFAEFLIFNSPSPGVLFLVEGFLFNSIFLREIKIFTILFKKFLFLIAMCQSK